MCIHAWRHLPIMRMTHSVFRQILLFAENNFPNEVGGALGARDDVVVEFFADNGLAYGRKDAYAPNTELINKQIQIWSKNNISFSGIFHSHPDRGKSLSGNDVYYIQRIMRSLPASVDSLYFPIVTPANGSILIFKAVFKNGDLKITREELETF